MVDVPIQLRSDKLDNLYRYWLAKKGRRKAPARAEIWPEEMLAFLPYLFLVDVVGARFRFRLVGTKVVEACGEDHTGDYFDEAGLDVGEAMAEYRIAVAERHPMVRSWDLAKDDKHYLRYERLILPLSADGERVNMLLCGMAMEDLGSQATVD